MSSVLVLLLPLALLAVCAVVVVLLVVLTMRSDATLTPELRQARRHGVVTSVLAGAALLLTPVLVVPVAFSLAPLGTVVGAVPLLAAGAALVVLWVGELSWPRPQGATRTALMHDRSVRTLLAGGWARVGAAASALLLLVLVLGGLLADESGRTVARVDVAPDGAMTERAASPFPGWGYGLPQLVSLTAVVVLVLLVLRAATQRATVTGADLETDRLLRRAAAARAFRLLAFGALLTAGADLVLGGAAARRVLEGPGPALALAAVLVGLGCALTALLLLLVPAPRLPAGPAGLGGPAGPAGPVPAERNGG